MLSVEVVSVYLRVCMYVYMWVWYTILNFSFCCCFYFCFLSIFLSFYFLFCPPYSFCHLFTFLLCIVSYLLLILLLCGVKLTHIFLLHFISPHFRSIPFTFFFYYFVFIFIWLSSLFLLFFLLVFIFYCLKMILFSMLLLIWWHLCVCVCVYVYLCGNNLFKHWRTQFKHHKKLSGSLYYFAFTSSSLCMYFLSLKRKIENKSCEGELHFIWVAATDRFSTFD